MTLNPKETEKLEFVEIQKSKHARYVNGVVVAKDSVAKDYVAPGAALCKIESGDDENKYAPVTRGTVDSVTNGSDRFEMDDADQLWNFQVGDVVESLDDSGDKLTGHSSDDMEIEEIDTDNNYIIVKNIESTEHDTAAWLQKVEGTPPASDSSSIEASSAELVCLELIDVSDEDAIVGGITHGAVYKDRMPNYDEIVEEELPMIAFEGQEVQSQQQ